LPEALKEKEKTRGVRGGDGEEEGKKSQGLGRRCTQSEAEGRSGSATQKLICEQKGRKAAGEGA